MMGSAASRPKRELLLSTRMLVGPGVMEATKANSTKGSQWLIVAASFRGERSGRLGDMAIGSVGLRMAE